MKTENIKNKELLFSIIIASILFLLILINSGAVNSGYHMVDDHGTLDKVIALRKPWSLFDNIVMSMKGDLTIRFRPLYVISTCIKSKLLGSDINAWMYLAMCEGIVSWMLLYFFSRNLQFSVVESILFSTIVIFGKQIEPWYRALNQENEGMLLASAGLFYISYLNKRDMLEKKPKRIVLIIIITLCSMMKESFSATVPLFILFVLYLDFRKNTEAQTGELLKRNFDILLSGIILFVIESVIILFYVGTNSVGYAGFSKEDGASYYIHRIIAYAKSEWRIYFYLGLIGVIIFIWSLAKKVINIKSRQNILLIFIFIYGVSSQLLLYAKVGMKGRYLLPFLLIWCAFFVLGILHIAKNNNTIFKIYIITCSLCLVIGLSESFVSARKWSIEGEKTQNVLESIYENVIRVDAESILVDMDAGEYNTSIISWWNYWHPDMGVSLYRKNEYGGFETYFVIVTSYESIYEDTYFSDMGLEREDYSIAEIEYPYVIATYEKN